MLYNFTLCCLLACLDTILSSMHTVTCLYLSQWLPDKDLSSEPLSPLVSLQSSGWRCGDVCWSLWWVSVYQLFLCHCRHHPGLLYWTPAHNGIINTTWCDSTCLYHLALYWSISLSSKIRLMRFLVTSTFLYACESWTLTAELQRRIQAMEMRCYRKILGISYNDHVTNEEVRAKIQPAIGLHEDLLTIVKRCKLQWYDHVSRSSGLTKTIL